MSAWGHVIAVMGSVEAKPLRGGHSLSQPRRESYTRHRDGVLVEYWIPNCAGRNCDEPPRFLTNYSYVTGRAGRVTDRAQYWCDGCAERWCSKHNLALPTSSPSTSNGPRT